ncbi:MAG TPA: 2-oxo-4-hydroxy-4-carboxy-5-ureidoimidazoline decarboxylase [Longimicrobiales bacterium]
MTLTELNDLPAEDAEQVLLSCCGSRTWARRMAAQRPYATATDLLQAADEVARGLTEDDWLEAFAAHPRIGERSTSAWSQAEQAAALNASSDVQRQLARANREFEELFGFNFIVFASGKTPEKILELMAERMQCPRPAQVAHAAAEQRKITDARLKKLLEL